MKIVIFVILKFFWDIWPTSSILSVAHANPRIALTAK